LAALSPLCYAVHSRHGTKVPNRSRNSLRASHAVLRTVYTTLLLRCPFWRCLYSCHFSDLEIEDKCSSALYRIAVGASALTDMLVITLVGCHCD